MSLCQLVCTCSPQHACALQLHEQGCVCARACAVQGIYPLLRRGVKTILLLETISEMFRDTNYDVRHKAACCSYHCW